jgi:hypothetical protein
MAPFRPRLEIEDIGEELGRDPFVLSRDDRVIEFDTHLVLPSRFLILTRYGPKARRPRFSEAERSCRASVDVEADPGRLLDRLGPGDSFSDEQKLALVALLTRSIANDRYPSSPHVCTLRDILSKLDPKPPAQPSLAPKAHALPEETRTRSLHQG